MRVIGGVVFFVAGILMFIIELFWFNYWWGTPGLLGGIFVPPLAAAFPFIFLVKEGAFSLFYFGLWGIGIIGALLASRD